MRENGRIMFLPALFALSVTLPAAPEAAATAYFERKVRPLLIARCYGCHSTTARKPRSGLLLDSRKGWVVGGSRGPAIVPGDPAASLVVKAVRYSDPDLRMPPKGKLSDVEVGILERWIANGAADPRDGSLATGSPTVAGGHDFWSFQPLAEVRLPAVDDTTWPRTDVDAFLLARLEAEGLQPVQDASRRILARRIHFALTGLPPTPEAIRAFVTDDSPNALERLVDQLLGSPRFGERWGQHWLDAARFAESSGGGRSLMLKNAWRYRDYVIAAFNSDKPYDRFVTEQIAGDLLPFDNAAERDDNLVATGYLALGPTNYELQDKDLLRMEVVDEQIDTIGRTFLSMTLGCARCHDHKFDPVPTTDYYALAGIFRSTKTLIPGNVSGYVERTLSTDPPHQAAHDRYNSDLAALNKGLAEARETHTKLQAGLTDDDAAGVKSAELGRLVATIQDLKKRLATLKKTAPPPLPKTMSVREEEATGDWHVLLRGGIRDLGPTVQRGFLTAMERSGLAAKPKLAAGHSGRLELARWLTAEENALAARVIVNRVWHHLFDNGLVRTTDNFGHTGEAPSHPDLLDYLARKFLSDGRSIKRLVRHLVLSRSYGLAATAPDASDPDNRLLSRAPRKRIDAEELRDTLLAVSGLLDAAAGGLTIRRFSLYDLGYEFDTRRRSVYIPRFRNSIHEVLDIFDAANPNLVTGRRSESTLATQALFLLNSPLVAKAARHAAAGLMSTGLPLEDSIDQAYLETLGRPPSSSEREISLRHLRQDGTSPHEPPAEGLWADLYQVLFGCLDFRYLH